MIIPGRYRQPFSICCRIQSNPDDPKTLLAMLRSCNRSAGENNRQIALSAHFKLERLTVYVFFFRYLGRGWFARILCLYTGSENHA